MSADWKFQKAKSLPVATYLRCDTPVESVAQKKKACERIKKEYNSVRFCQEAIAQQDLPLIKYLVEKEGVDIYQCKFTKSAMGRKKPISPLEYAERKKWPEFLQYVRSLSQGGTPKKPDQDYVDSYTGGSSLGDVSEDSSSERRGKNNDTFKHSVDYPHIPLSLDMLAQKMSTEKYQLLHFVEMSMVSLIDKKRVQTLAPRACWLFNVFLRLLEPHMPSLELRKEAIQLWKTSGPDALPIVVYRFEDHDTAYANHAFVKRLVADVPMGPEARERTAFVSSFLEILFKLGDIYREQFPPARLASGFFTVDTTPAPTIDLSASSNNELPPENASIPRGFLGTLGKEHRERLGDLIASKSE